MRLLRLVCALVGHVWTEPFRVMSLRVPAMYIARCRRCRTEVVGDWDTLETERVWQHYRRIL